jgi:hypothetical protein
MNFLKKKRNVEQQIALRVNLNFYFFVVSLFSFVTNWEKIELCRNITKILEVMFTLIFKKK